MPGSNIMLLSNSFSGNGKGRKYANTIMHTLSNVIVNVVHYNDDWPQDLNSYDYVWIVGGDGTLNYFLNRYPLCSIPITIFAGGTGNDFHWKLYGKMKLENQISQMLNCNTRSVDIGKCNDEYFINTVGLGFDGEVLKDMKKVRKIGGHLGYLFIVIKNIFSYVEKKYTIEIDKNESIVIESLLCIISNSSRTGGGFMVSPLADIEDGLLNIVYSEKLSILQRIKLLLKVEKGNHLDDKNIKHHTLQKIKITCDEDVYYQLDGDLRKANTFDIGIIEKGIKFLC